MRFFRFLSMASRPLLFLIFRLKIEGREHIPAEGPLLLCSNHRSYADPFFLVMALKGRPIRFIAKEELFRGPLAFFVRLLGAIPVRRDSADADALKSAAEALRQGEVLGIFPEGTRSLDGTPGKPKAGAMLLVQRTQAPLLPAAIIVKGRVRPFKKTTVRLGPVLTPADLGLAEGGGRAALRGAARAMMDCIIALTEPAS